MNIVSLILLAVTLGCTTGNVPVLTATPTHSLPEPITSETPFPSPTQGINSDPVITPTLTTPKPPSGQLTLMAVGDIMLARTLGDQIIKGGPGVPFAHTSTLLNSADISLGNLECSISERGIAEDKTYTFRAPLVSADSLVSGGFDLLTLANNHVLDFGVDALADTIELLTVKGIETVGAGMNIEEARSPVLMERNGLRLAFLAYLDIPRWNYDYLTWIATADKPGVSWGYLSNIMEDVQAASQIADVVIVLMHFGTEGEVQPSYQQILSAHTAIDAGAKLVIGSHTHLLQPIEEYNDGLIVYNLGNFVFDEFGDLENESAIFKALISKDGVIAYEMLPVFIQESGLPILTDR
ncbi:MAG: CapA family protein [Anaerolineaceae bacterium]|nr:CapA family protein [Anaerolineaceae bacterium]